MTRDDSAPTVAVRPSTPPRSTSENAGVSDGLRPGWIVLLLFLAAFLLNSFGRDWGLPNDAPWQDDAIEGMEVVNHWPSLWSGAWAHKYPRVPFILNSILYKPLLDRWSGQPVQVRESAGPQERLAILTIPRITVLIRISRTLEAVMGAGVVVGVFLLARRMFQDQRAAVLAALCAMLCRDLTLYSHWGSVDVQATFWFVWSLYFAWRVLERLRWRDCLVLGMFIGLAVCTKEPLGAYAIGLAVSMGVLLTLKSRAQGRRSLASLNWLTDKRLLAAAALSLLLFLFINNALTHPAEFMARMRNWTASTGVVEWNMDYSGQLDLLFRSCRDVYGNMGWPLSLAVVLGAAYAVRRFPEKAIYALLPIIAFYLIIITQVHFTMPRYYLPGLPGLFLVAGKGLADLTRSRRIPRAVSVAAAGLVLGLSLAYCLAAMLEMKCDTRRRAEQWFVEHVPVRTEVAALTSRTYAPQLATRGFYYRRGRAHNEEPQTVVQALGALPAPPSFLILVNASNADSRNAKTLEALLGERFGYRRVITFERLFLEPHRSALDIAGWPVSEPHPFLSPRVVILARK